MQERFDRIFQAFFEPLDLLDDEGQRERVGRLFGVGRPGLERALADLLADVLDEVNEHLDDVRAELVFRGSNEGGFVVEVKTRAGAATPNVDEAGMTDDEDVFDPADAEKLTLRLPGTLKERAAAAAALEGLSLNSWIVRTVARELSGREGRRRSGREFRREERGRPDGGGQLRGWVGG